jgi:hypothetical protein
MDLHVSRRENIIMPVELNYSEQTLLKLYPSLNPVTELKGVYEAVLTGPRFLIPLKRLFLRLSGLPGWAGKHFKGDYALNMLAKGGQVKPGPKMLLANRPHKMDSKVGMVATYDERAPWLWRRCTDEFRVLDDDSVLGISYFDLPGFRNKPILFLLRFAPHNDGVI